MAGTSSRRKAALELRARESAFTRRVYLPVQDFIHIEWIGSAFLLAAAVAALVWANSPWAGAYHDLWETYLSIDVGLFEVSRDLHHWVNDGLMAVFFFVVALEIKRELLHGNLSSAREAALPVVAAVGGMVVPAAVYLLITPGGEAGRGWGIPMATDIAFALGVLGLLGRRIPSRLRIFLLALAIVDDLGAIMVIAIFYTESISGAALGWAAAALAVVAGMRLAGVRRLGAYMVAGFLFWAAVLESGIHATLAGVLLGALTPSRPLFDRADLEENGPRLLEDAREARLRGDEDAAQAALGRLEELVEEAEAPLTRLERMFHPWSAYLVLPLFALANAGVELSGDALRGALESPVAWGVVLGLLVGKVVGILGASAGAYALGIARLPEGVGWRHIGGASILAGIGFTVSLFIAELAFTAPALIAEAKLGILVASLLAGIVGYLVLLPGTPPERAGEGEGPPDRVDGGAGLSDPIDGGAVPAERA